MSVKRCHYKKSCIRSTGSGAWWLSWKTRELVMHQQNQNERKYAFSSLYIYMGAVVTWIRDSSGFWLHDSKKKVPEFFLTLFGANSLNVIDILWIILQWYSVHAFTNRNWNCHFLKFLIFRNRLQKTLYYCSNSTYFQHSYNVYASVPEVRKPVIAAESDVNW